MAKRVLDGEALIERAEQLGVNISTEMASVMVTGRGAGEEAEQFERAPEHEIQRRVMEAERHIREHRLWIVTLVAAAASVVSAIAAWTAVAVIN